MIAVYSKNNVPIRFTQKCLIVAYRETAVDDGFILAAYLARRPSARRRITWTQ